MNFDISNVKGKWGQPEFFDGEIYGLDTETADGDIFAIGVAGPNGVTTKFEETLFSEVDLFGFLTQRKFRNSLNFFYNLHFDVNALFKTLDPLEIEFLHVQNSVCVNGKEIFYIPKKCLQIRKDKNVYRFWDLAQFCYTDLSGAAAEWIESDVDKQDINVKQFGKDRGKVNKFIKNNRGEIIDYLRTDCLLTRDIAKNLVNEAQTLGIPFKTPYSTGYIAGEYLKTRSEKVGFSVRKMQDMAWNAYRGGRFECIRRGYFEQIYGFDINSAYPYHLSQLPDPSTCEIYRGCRYSDIESADYGFARAKVTTAKRPVQPFPVKDEKVVFPRLVDREIVTTKHEIDTAIRHGLIHDFNVLDCWGINETDQTRYPFEWIQDMYRTRKEYEQQGKEKKAKLIKIILNSLYGKFCQTVIRREVKNENPTEATAEFFGLPVTETKVAGEFFNPFVATQITARTRCQLLNFVMSRGLEDEVIMFATDCVAIPTKVDISGKKGGLGGWEMEYGGNGLVIGSGVYEIRRGGEQIKQKTRGFRGVDRSLIEYARKAKSGEIDLEVTRPFTYGQAINENKSFEKVAKFMDFSRTLSADFDDKRKWESIQGFDGLLSGNQRSNPLEYCN